MVNHISAGNGRGGVGGDLRPGSLEGGVRDRGRHTRPGFDHHLGAQADIFLYRLRRRRAALLMRPPFLQDADLHALPNPVMRPALRH